MNTIPPSRNDLLTLRRLWPALVGILVFGVLMGLRSEFPSIWARAAVAACAFIAIGLGVRATRISRT